MKGIVPSLVKRNIICRSLLLFCYITPMFGDYQEQLPFDPQQLANNEDDDGGNKTWSLPTDIDPDYQISQNDRDIASNILLELNSTKAIYIEENRLCRWFYLSILTPGRNMLMVMVIPHLSRTVTWKLLHRKQDDIGEISQSSPSETPLYSYSGTEQTSFIITEIKRGLYIVDMCATAPNTGAYIYISENNPELLTLADNPERPRRIRVKKYFKSNSVNIRWPETSLAYGAPQYQIHWNTRQFYSSAYEFLSDNITMVFCDPNHPFMNISELVLNETYYVHVFFATNDGLSVLYAKTSFTFRKSKPIGLRDGVVTVGNLTSNNGKLSFRYKVGNVTSPSYRNVLMFYIIPCQGAVTVEIKYRKKNIINKTKINKYTKFEIGNLTVKDRFVIKITDATNDDVLISKRVQVFATVRPKLYVLPDPISDFEIKEYHNKFECSFESLPTIVTWAPIASNETIYYCIHVTILGLNITESDLQNVSKNECERADLVFRLNNIKSESKCQKQQPTWKRRPNSIPHLKEFLKLKPGVDYIVMITVKKPSFNRHTRYNLKTIRVARNISCHSDTNLSYIFNLTSPLPEKHINNG